MRRKMRRIQGEQSEAKKEKEEREGRGEREGREYEKERLRPREGRVADGTGPSTLFVPRNQNSVLRTPKLLWCSQCSQTPRLLVRIGPAGSVALSGLCEGIHAERGGSCY